MKKARLICFLITIFLFIHWAAPQAEAHPLGNFTLNHFAGLHLTPDTVLVDYILDMAEIPAFQEITKFDHNGNGQPDPTEAATYHPQQCETVGADLSLQLNNHSLTLTVTESAVTFPSGAGNLPTLRLRCSFQASFGQITTLNQFVFENNVYPKRLGWREIVVTSEALLLDNNVAGLQTSLTNRLTDYPDDLLTQPLDQSVVSFAFQLQDGVGIASASTTGKQVQFTESTQPYLNRNDQFTSLISMENLTLPTMLLALVIAFVWGGAHALTPGHGKTIVAAYLVGSRGTIKHALFLGLTTTVTHTAGVFSMGLISLFASRYILPETLYPWLSVLWPLACLGGVFPLSELSTSLAGSIKHRSFP